MSEALWRSTKTPLLAWITILALGLYTRPNSSAALSEAYPVTGTGTARPNDVQATTRRVRHQVSCATCKVEFTPVARIGRETDPHLVSLYTTVDQDSKGRFYAFSDYSEVLLYDSQGRFLRTIGRSGDGPGELGSPLILPDGATPKSSITQVSVGRGDTIFVFHGLHITVFSPVFEAVRAINITPVGTALGSLYSLPDGSWLLGGDFRRDPALAGRSIHIARPDGRVHRPLGPESALLPGRAARIPLTSSFKLARDEQSIWIRNGYSFERRRVSDNALEEAIEVTDVPWISAAQSSASGTVRPGTVARAALHFRGIDSVGHMWMVGCIPVPPPRARGDARPLPTCILELFDPRTAAVRSSQRMSGFPQLLPKGNLAFWGEYGPNGIPVLVVSRFSFTGPRGPQQRRE